MAASKKDVAKQQVKEDREKVREIEEQEKAVCCHESSQCGYVGRCESRND